MSTIRSTCEYTPPPRLISKDEMSSDCEMPIKKKRGRPKKMTDNLNYPPFLQAIGDANLNGHGINNGAGSSRRNDYSNSPSEHKILCVQSIKPTLTMSLGELKSPKFDSTSLFNNSANSDVTVHVTVHNSEEKPTVFHAHKFILAGSSPVFATMLASGGIEDKMEFIDTDPATVEEFLRLIYTGKPRNISTLAVNLLHFAIVYGIESLKEYAFPYAMDAINAQNFVETFKAVEMLHKPELTRKAAEHFGRIKGWLIKDNNDLAKLFECPELMFHIVMN